MHKFPLPGSPERAELQGKYTSSLKKKGRITLGEAIRIAHALGMPDPPSAALVVIHTLPHVRMFAVDYEGEVPRVLRGEELSEAFESLLDKTAAAQARAESIEVVFSLSEVAALPPRLEKSP